jgi:DNA-directed RNA polymerases I, II, and III subunit RPABC3
MPNPILLEDTFSVKAINPDGAVYLRVSRAVCSNQSGDLTVTTDYNLEEFPLVKDERLAIAIASSLELSGEVTRNVYDHSIYHRETLLNQYDYVMHGRIYECNAEEDDGKPRVTILISFGGLLCKVEGHPEILKELHFNADVFLLIKRVGK